MAAVWLTLTASTPASLSHIASSLPAQRDQFSYAGLRVVGALSIGEGGVDHQFAHAVAGLLGKEAEQTGKPKKVPVGLGDKKLMAVGGGHADATLVEREVDMDEARESVFAQVARGVDLKPLQVQQLGLATHGDVLEVSLVDVAGSSSTEVCDPIGELVSPAPGPAGPTHHPPEVGPVSVSGVSGQDREHLHVTRVEVRGTCIQFGKGASSMPGTKVRPVSA